MTTNPIDLDELTRDLAAEGRPTPGAWLRLGAVFAELEEHRRRAARAERIEQAARPMVHAVRDLLEQALPELDVQAQLPELPALEDAIYTTPAEEATDAAR